MGDFIGLSELFVVKLIGNPRFLPAKPIEDDGIFDRFKFSRRSPDLGQGS